MSIAGLITRIQVALASRRIGRLAEELTGPRRPGEGEFEYAARMTPNFDRAAALIFGGQQPSPRSRPVPRVVETEQALNSTWGPVTSEAPWKDDPDWLTKQLGGSPD